MRALRVFVGLLASVWLATPVHGQHGHGGGHSSGGYRSPSLHMRSPRAPSTRIAPPARSYAPKFRSPSSRSYKPRAPSVRAPRSASPRGSTPHQTLPRDSRHPRLEASPEGRDSRGRIKRSDAAKEQFMRQTGHPHGWPGHVVDHIVPLAEGGKDDPSNMQWQTVEEAKAKDKVECGGQKCGAGHRHP